MRTLLLEDDATTRRYLKELLQSLGHEVVACATGDEAWASYEAEPCELLLLDWLMPDDGMDGLELCRRVKRHSKATDIPSYALVVTVRDDVRDLEAVLEAGADDYVPKPVTPEALAIRVRIGVERIRDAIARKDAEQALLFSRNQLSHVVVNAPLILFMLDRKGVFTFAEGQGLRRVGLKAEALIGSSVFDFSEQLPKMAAHVGRALAGEEFSEMVRVGAGAFECWYAPIERSGVTTGAMVVAADVSVRLGMEEGKREAEERIRRFAEAAFEGLALIDDGVVVDANPQIAEMFDIEPNDIIGQHVRNFVQEEDRDRARTFLDNPTDDPIELNVFGPSRGDFLIEVRLRPYSLGERHVAVLAVQDITTRRKQEEEHLRIEEQLRQTQKMESLGVLAGGIAHDFNNLLMGVLGNASLALMDLPADSPALEHIRQIEGTAQRAAELTNQMLAFSGKGKFVLTRLNMSHFVTEMRTYLEAALPEGTQVEYQLDPVIPEIEADSAQIRQILLNLLTNAADALEGGPGIIKVRTGVRHVSEEIVSESFFQGAPADRFSVFLEVQDNGMGMNEEIQTRIFEPFFTTKFTGRGLGMAAVLGIVRGHKGGIRVRSMPGRGSTVTVYLPPCADATITAEHAIPDALLERGEQGTVLIVDDEETVRIVTGKMLERVGHKVLVAQDGAEGLSLFEEHQSEIALVLLDLTMPDMGGEQVYLRMSEQHPAVRVILMSGYDEEEATTHFKGRGLAGFLQKPFSAALLRERVKEALE